MTTKDLVTTADLPTPTRRGRRRLVVTAVLSAALVAACGGGGSDGSDDDALATLERQVAIADDTMNAVAPRLIDELGGRTTGGGTGQYGTCVPSPSSRVGYTAKVTFRALGGSGDEVTEVATPVLEDLGWTVEPQASGLRATQRSMVLLLNPEGEGARFTIDTDCVGVPDEDEVVDRPEKDFGLG